jgi:hypothetical protein
LHHLKLFAFLQILHERTRLNTNTENDDIGPLNLWDPVEEGEIGESKGPGSLAEEATEPFTIPEECKHLLASTLLFAMDQMTPKEPAAYSAYVRVLKQVSGDPLVVRL